MPSKGRLPADIPADPSKTYADKGWKGVGDWLGTERSADQLKEYRSFHEARAFACKLKLKNVSEWIAFTKGRMPRLGRLPTDIPARPGNTYADKGWKGYGDWLGTGNIAPFLREYRSFREARVFARKLKLKNQSEWRFFAQGRMPQVGQLPADIPANVVQSYANKGWTNWGDWLGTGYIAPALRKYRPFRKARAFVRRLKLKSKSEWFTFTQGRMPRLGRLPKDIPSNPGNTYADKGWKGYGDWLGTGQVAPQLKEYRPFEKARNFARTLKLKNQSEWIAFTQGRLPRLGRLPQDIPAYPGRPYASKGWNGMGDWLGTGRTRRTKS
jgi:hypothetical protein